jgi:hypothetical protein
VPGVLLPVWEPQVWFAEFDKECCLLKIMTMQDRLVRAGVYMLAMAYLFFGVSIVSDRFMAASELKVG